MMFPVVSLLPQRLARVKFSLFVLALVTLLLPATARAQTANGGAISNTAGDYSTHSSTATISGATGPVATVVVELKGVTSDGQTYFSVQGTQFMLESPGGQKFAFLGYTGNGTDGDNAGDSGSGLAGVNITVQDGKNPAPDGATSNPLLWPHTGSVTVEPSSYAGYPGNATPIMPGGDVPSAWPQYDSCSPDNYASGCSGNTMNGALAGATANGTWTLYMNDEDGDPVSITGWSLTLTTSSATPTTTTLSSSQANPYTNTSQTVESSVTFTATVSGSGTPTGTVAFTANGSAISGCNAVAVSGGQAHCTTTLAQGYNSIDAAYTATGAFANSSGSMTQLVEEPATNPSGDTWCNNAPVSMVSGIPLAYPDIIKVSNAAYNGKTVGNVTVELEGATSADGMLDAFLLVAPGGGVYNLDFADVAFNGSSMSNANLTFSDSGSDPYGTTATTGTYLPWDGNLTTSNPFPALQSPAIDTSIPAVPGTPNLPQTKGGANPYTLEQAFNGAPANGEWALYIEGGEPIALNNGWCVNLTINPGTATTTVVTSSQQKATTGNLVTVTATVTSSGNPVTSGTVTFKDTTTDTALASNVALNGSGQAAYSTSSLTEGDHKITATYNGNTTYNTSFGSVWQRLDDATAVTAVNSNTWQFCNSGAVKIPASASGAFTPNPSNIFVSNLPGTLNTLTLALDNFAVPGQDQIYQIASLLEGPTGSALDFFSNTGGAGTEIASSGNYIFSDTASGLVPEASTNLSPGTYKPTAYELYTSQPDTFTSSPSGFYNAPGSFFYAQPHGSPAYTFNTGTDNAFYGTNPTGTWSLFFNQVDEGSAAAGASNGWCLNLTENLPAVTVTKSHSGNFSQGQQNAEYKVDIVNNGPGSTGDPTGSNPLTVTDTLNSAFTYSNYSGTGWSCSAAGQTVTCTNDSAIADGNSYPELVVDVNVSATASGSIGNSVSARGAGVPVTSSNTDNVTIVPAPVLSVQKTHTGTFTQGQTAEWDIAVSNTASASSTTSGTVSVSDALPAGYTVSSFGSTSAFWSCSGLTAVSCSTTLTESGGSAFPAIQVIVNVPANSPTSVSNTALAWGGGDLNHTSSGTAASGTDSNVLVAQVPATIAVNAGGTQSAQVLTAFATGLAVIVKDANSVPIQGASVTFTAPSTGASGTFSNSSNTITAATDTNGVANAGVFTANAIAGAYGVTASVVGVATPATFSLTNNAGAATHFSVVGPGSVTAGVPFNFTVTALDASNNTANGYTGTVHFTSSDGAAALPANATLASGTGTFSATLKTAGSQTISAMDTVNAALTGSATIGVVPGPAASLAITAPPSAIAGTPFNLTVSAYDLYGNLATGYTGTVAFTSTDPNASLPASTTLTNGTGTFSGTLVTAGSQTITATDAVNTLTATTNGITVTMQNLVVTTANDDAGTASNCTAQTTPGTGTDAACSLRDALLFATSTGAANISFDSTAFASTNTVSANTITLTNGTLSIPANTAIMGPTSGIGSTLSNLVTVAGGGSTSNFPVLTLNANATNVVIANLTITNGYNTGGTGGGIVNGYQAGLTLMNCTISGNAAPSAVGGIFNDYGAALSLIGSTLSGNTGGAGGILNEPGGTVTVTSSTISGNTASNSGGGIVNGGTAVSVTASTISGNSAVNNGGGILSTTGTVTLANSVLSGNTAATGPDVNGSYTDNGGNQIGAAAINLATLANYGGPAQTMLPLPGSTAICGGTLANATAAGLTGDQRGLPFDSNCPTGSVDAGAVQTNYALSFTTEPPLLPASAVAGVAISPAPVVGLTEKSAAAAMAASSLITMTDSAALLGGTTSANLASGSATFSNLIFNSGTSNDTLTATLALNSSLTPPLNLTATSTFVTALSSQAITFTPITGSQYALSSVTLSASASSGLPVAFSTITPAVCSVSGSTLSLLTQGTCVVYAAQAGNSSYAAALTTAQSFAVHPVGQTITFTAITGTQYAATQLALNATASSGLAVNVTSTTPAVCSVSGGTLSLLTAGTCVLHASQAGNSVYAEAPTLAQSFSVRAVSQTITFPAITGTHYVSTQLTLNATASSGLAVAFTSATPAVCSVSGTTLSLLTGGTCVIHATQPGNSDYAAAPTVVQNFAVHLVSQTITFTPVTGTQYALSSVTLSATASSSLTVSFASTTPAVCSASGSTLSLLTGGTCIVQALQAGNGNYAPAATAQSFAVHHVPQTISFPAITGTQVAGTNLTLTATATSGLTVSFASTTTPVCSVSGTTLSLLAKGTCVLHATQAGNSVYAAAPTLAQSFAVKAN